MVKATSKFNPVIKQDINLTEEVSMDETQQVEDTTTQAPGIVEVGTQDQDKEQLTPEPVVNVVVKVEPVVQPETDTQTDLEKLLAKVEAEGNAYRKGIIFTLNKYCDAMKPGKVIEPAEGARNHYQLWHGILSILNSCPEEEFRTTWNTILAYFNLNQNSALNDRFIFRFMHEWAQGNDQCKAYQHIINLIKLTMDPKQRATGLKQVSLERSLTEVISEAGRGKLVAFYQV